MDFKAILRDTDCLIAAILLLQRQIVTFGMSIGCEFLSLLSRFPLSSSACVRTVVPWLKRGARMRRDVSASLQYWPSCNGPQLPTEISNTPKHELPDNDRHIRRSSCFQGAWALRGPPAGRILSAQEGTSGAQPHTPKSALKRNTRCCRSTLSTRNPTTSAFVSHIAPQLHALSGQSSNFTCCGPHGTPVHAPERPSTRRHRLQLRCLAPVSYTHLTLPTILLV